MIEELELDIEISGLGSVNHFRVNQKLHSFMRISDEVASFNIL